MTAVLPDHPAPQRVPVGVPVGVSLRERSRELLDGLRAARAEADAAEVRILVGATTYADLHPALDTTPEGLDELLGAGPGLDEVEAACTGRVAKLAEMTLAAPAEFGLALGLSHDAAARLIADALQLRHRLPSTWAEVTAGRVQAWRARRIAQATAGQPDDVVTTIDAHLATIAAKVGLVTLDRLLDTAMLRLHPEERELRQQEQLDHRHATLRTDLSHHGTARMEIAADLKDLLDFDDTLAALAHVLGQPGQPGSTESLDVRRSMAVGVLADPDAAAHLLRTHTQHTQHTQGTQGTQGAGGTGSTGSTAEPGAAEPSGRCWPAPSRPWADDRPHPAADPHAAEPTDPADADGADGEDDPPEPPDDDYPPDDQPDDEPEPQPQAEPHAESQVGSHVGSQVRPHAQSHAGSGNDGEPRLSEQIWPWGWLPPLPPPQPPTPCTPGTPGRAPASVRPPAPVQPPAPVKPRKQFVLYAHLTHEALHGRDVAARVETPGHGTGQPTLTTLLRDWCGRTDTQITIKPVIDLTDHHRTDAYEIPDRLREHVILRDGHCAFPWCTRTARACDLDHIVPYHPPGHETPSGATCTCNLAPLCRRHHNLKTHHHWTYTTLEPGTWIWTSPLGYTYLRDETGTRDVTPPDHPPGTGCHHPD